MDGAIACDGRADKCLGTSELKVQRLGLESRFARWMWGRLAAGVQGFGALLRSGGKICRRYRDRGRAGTFARWTISTADAADVPGSAGSRSREAKAGPDGDAGAFGESNAAAEWARTVPLLRSLRAWMRDAFIFQRGVHNSG